MLTVVACTEEKKQDVSPKKAPELTDLYGEQVYQVLLAEYLYQQGDYKTASNKYNQLLLTRADANVARRATELAIKTDDFDQALVAAQQWKSLKPVDAEVNQYLILLYQEKKNFDGSAQALADIVNSSPSKEARALDLAVAMLERQSDIEAAYRTLKSYVKNLSESSSKTLVNEDSKKDKDSNKGKATAEEQANTAIYYLGLFAMRAKLFDEAISSTENLTKIENKELQRKTALLRIKAFSALDKSEQALIELKQLIAEAADSDTKKTYARIVASLGKTDEALALLAQAYDDYPDKAELLLDMIAINLGDEKYEKAHLLVDQLQDIEDQEYNTHYYRGLTYESEGKFAEALKEYSAIDKQPSMKVIFRMATVLQEVKGLEKTLAYIHQKQQDDFAGFEGNIKEVKAELYLLESEILRRNNRSREALEANKKAEKLSPMNLEIIYSQALLYEDIKQIDKSEEKLQQILRVNSNHSAALNALGYMLSVHTSRLDEAYLYIKKAYTLEPDDPAIIDSLGWVAYRKGDLQDAERYLRIAYQKLQDPEVASHLVEVLAKRGQKDEATKVLKEMLVKHPENKLLMDAWSVIKEQ